MLNSAFVFAALLTTFCCVKGQNLRDGRALQSGIEQDELGRQFVHDSYIVTLQRDSGDVTVIAKGLVQELGGQLEHVYDVVLNGFAAVLPIEAVEALEKNPNVASIERNYLVSVFYKDTDTASWGLDRIDQCVLPGDSTLNTGFLGTSTTGNESYGGNAYVIDTGILYDHAEFGSKVDASCSMNFVDTDPTNWIDTNGHGTHVAAIIGGKTYGVARNCPRLCAVRVVNSNGTGNVAAVIAGINFVAKNAPRRSVVNVSVGGTFHGALNQAVNNLAEQDIVVVAAAGNDAKDACGVSPASATGVITVGAIDSKDIRVSSSNFGSCVTIFAPGYAITSAWIGNDTSRTISGTSIAASFVAGLVMLYWEQNQTMTSFEITNLMLSRSSKNVVVNAKSSNAHVATVPTVNCGPCNEDGICPSQEIAAAVLCVADNCSCKQSGGSCKVSTECCSNNCFTIVGTSTCA